MDTAPIGPREFAFERLSPKQFEFLCQLLIKNEFPEAVGTEDPDGGADMVLAGSDSSWERAWQVKRFTGTVRWAQCRASLTEAIATYQITRMTFCFARDLTLGQLRSWVRLQQEFLAADLDFWAKTDLTSRLIGSEQGERIANVFFVGPPPSGPDINRMLRAGVLLESGRDALDRIVALVEQASQRDPNYTYAFLGIESDRTSPPTPGTMMSVTQLSQGASSRIDAIPRTEGLASANPPVLTITFDDGEHGRRAAAAFEQASRSPTPTTVNEGFTISPTNLPDLFEELIGSPHPASITLSPQPPPPWEIICEAVTDRGLASFPFTLRRADGQPDEGLRLTGTRYGATIDLQMLPQGELVQMSATLSHWLDDSTLVEHAEALRFMVASCGSGTLTIRDRSGRVPPIVSSVTSQPSDADWILGLIEDMAYVQAVTGIQFEIPDTITTEDAAWFRTAAEVFRDGMTTLRWSGRLITGELADPLPDNEGAVRIEENLTISLLGHEISLGRGVLNLERIKLVDRGAVPEDSTRRIIELRPPEGEPLDVEWQRQA